jgi:hypothetical protein
VAFDSLRARQLQPSFDVFRGSKRIENAANIGRDLNRSRDIQACRDGSRFRALGISRGFELNKRHGTLLFSIRSSHGSKYSAKGAISDEELGFRDEIHRGGVVNMRFN